MRKLFLTILVLGLACGLHALSFFKDGKVNGKLSLGKICSFEGTQVVDINMKGWGATIVPAERNWNGFDKLVFSLYSDGKAAELMITANCEDSSYYFYKVKIDWSGWRTVSLPLKSFRLGKKPQGWNNIAGIGFSPRGWDIKTNPAATVYMKDLELVKTEEQVKVTPIPLNAAESIICPLWDPALGDPGLWQKTPESAMLKPSWCGLDFKWRNRLVLSRKIELERDGFDSLVFSVVVPPQTEIKLSATDGKNKVEAVYRVADAKMKISEYVLPLKDLTRITLLAIELTNAQESNGYMKWIGCRNTQLLKELEAYSQRMSKLDLGKFVVSPPFGTEVKPGLNIFCDRERIDEIRREIADNAEAKKFLAESRATQLQQLSPQSGWREHVTSDRRWSIDRDYARGRMPDCIAAAWAGTLLNDQTLMLLAAKRAIVLAMVPNWGAGIYATLPGTAWEHRAFDESGVVTELIFTLDFCYDFFTPAGRDYILRRVAEKGVGTINFNVWKWNYIFNCNQLSAFSAARVIAYLAMEKSGWTHVKPYTELAIQELNESMKRILAPDGGYGEGPGYYQYTFWGALPAYYCYARARQKPFAEVLPPELKNAPNFVELSCSTDLDQAFIPYNDCGSGGVYPSTASFMNIMLPGSQFVRLYNRYLDKFGAPKINEYWSWLNGATRKKADPPYLPFTLVPSMASMSSVRDLDGETLKIVMLADAKKDAHKHPDVGQFIIELAGETLAMDSGGSRSYASPFTKVLQSEERHNVMLPVLADGSFGRQTVIRESLKLVASGDRKKFSAEIDMLPCWNKFFSQRSRKLSSDTPDRLTIEDRWNLKEGDGVAFLWLTQQEIKVNGREVIIAGKRGTAKFTVPEGWEIRTETLEREENTPQQRLTLTSRQRQGELKLDIRLALKR